MEGNLAEGEGPDAVASLGVVIKFGLYACAVIGVVISQIGVCLISVFFFLPLL